MRTVQVEHVRRNSLKKHHNKTTNKIGIPRERTPNDALTADEVERLIAGVSDLSDRTLFILGFSTGMRVSEISNIDEIRVNLNESTIKIWDEKKDINRTVYLSDEAKSALRLYMASMPSTRRKTTKLLDMSNKTIERRIQYWAGNILGKKISWHAVRHTYISLSREMEIPMEVVIANTGDSPFTILRYYSRFSPAMVLRFMNDRPIFSTNKLSTKKS